MMTSPTKKIKTVELTVDMVANSIELFDIIKPENVDLEPFKGFETKTLSIGSVLDKHQIEAFANDSKKLLTKCKNYASVIYAFYKEAKRRTDKIESIFVLTKSEELWSQKQAEYISKDSNYKSKSMTESIRSSLLSVDEEVERARILQIKWEALDKWFSDTMRDLENSHNWYKKLYDSVVLE